MHFFHKKSPQKVCGQAMGKGLGLKDEIKGSVVHLVDVDKGFFAPREDHFPECADKRNKAVDDLDNDDEGFQDGYYLGTGGCGDLYAGHERRMIPFHHASHLSGVAK